MTRQEIERLKAEANHLEPAERSEFLDLLGSSLCQVTLDKGGRITIPETFFEQLGLPEARHVWLSGSVDTFSIWRVADFEVQRAEGLDRKNSLKRKLGI
jgi:DNA-binding transcriptional regulator/RsmH inhibitor MraZ